MPCIQESAEQLETFGIEHIDGLYSYARILTRNHTEAEDIVQETYLRALPAMPRLKTKGDLKGWLCTILRNIWLNQLRYRARHPIVEIDSSDSIANIIAEPSADSLSLYLGKIEREEVQSAIQKLSIGYREIILLREYEDLSYQEIAAILDCPLGTVMSRLARARKKLRSLLCHEKRDRQHNNV
jgi:RNA polymerase sigma-70 factor, ECF subfamily